MTDDTKALVKWHREVGDRGTPSVKKTLHHTAATIERLERELDAMTADRDSWERQASDRADDVLAQAKRADQAERELAEARRDAGRYLYMRDHPLTFKGGVYVSWKPDELDATTDAAIAKERE